jgi:hypothetical protein
VVNIIYNAISFFRASISLSVRIRLQIFSIELYIGCKFANNRLFFKKIDFFLMLK